MRKLLTPAFHFKVLNDLMNVHDSQAKVRLERKAVGGKEFDIFPYVKRCALDIICEAAMGCHISSQENHKHPYVGSVRRLNELAFLHERMPWMWIQAIWYASSYGFEYDRTLKIATDFTRKRIAERLNENHDNAGQKKAFLDLLLDVQAEGNLSSEDIREEVDTFMFEGHDTTSSCLGWTLWFLAFNPEYQKKIQEEMDDIFGSTDRSCTSEDLKSMKYLEKCLRESLRLRPPVPNFSRKLEHDIDIGKCVLIPKGCSILIAPSMIHTNPTVYDDPAAFDPERFSDENIQKRHPYAYIPFSAGPRNCIGQKFALLEVKTVLSWFFRRFSISSLADCHANIPLPEIILKPSIGFPVIISKR
ncbi:unnamed protein product [Heligmosomoides polygyrus]|uniref:Cytochrome P450 4V2 n=1 Tax=Heligmosomoides polygyrus TaxID=6339 RepID=A0A183F2G5_HELPZ|nr:unnamed protein product [Heligmosomoides polygyrus]